jgi:hypothetical protein
MEVHAMSLRIRKFANGRTRSPGNEVGDGYSTRIAKLIPAEALGLYGAGQAIIPVEHVDGRIVLALASGVLTAVIRYQATKDEAGNPQWKAIIVAIISFILWVLTLRPPVGIVDLEDNGFYVTLAALIWGVFVPYIYKGSPATTPLPTSI